jgi:hypothetical protein
MNIKITALFGNVTVNRPLTDVTTCPKIAIPICE